VWHLFRIFFIKDSIGNFVSKRNVLIMLGGYAQPSIDAFFFFLFLLLHGNNVRVQICNVYSAAISISEIRAKIELFINSLHVYRMVM
jgi:hypothetical protein